MTKETPILEPVDGHILCTFPMVPYVNSVRQNHPCGNITLNNLRLICMIIISPNTDWLSIVQVLSFGINEVVSGDK